ncbi:MAG TPA: glycoside hydrolase family 15 protein [Acidimicrobiia bacterium]|nr:glycoside hydrolase family 15 protein [Acidimicrobiia bacterium]
MPSRIEQYAIIGDTQTAALIGDDGSVDWLCAPRFDSTACFAALLGDDSHGHWLIAPAAGGRAARRRYRDGTLVLETEFETPEGSVRITDFMPIREKTVDMVRIVEGLHGAVPMKMHLTIRFDYGSIIPWVREVDDALVAIGGPDALVLRTPVETRGVGHSTVADFTVRRGERVPFTLAWFPSQDSVPHAINATWRLSRTTSWWHDWSKRWTYDGDWPEMVQRSVITLKALTYAPTGGIVAAPTSSLPEWIGSVRNWDYRFCWLRDATFTLLALLHAGYEEEARAWRAWLLRAVAGEPSDLQIMYGPAGERRLTEWQVPWLPGYEGSHPVRIGNAASEQFQLDVYGEVIDALYQSRLGAIAEREVNTYQLILALLDFLEDAWKKPDEGIWEVRGPRQHFTHSKVMAWVAFDRASRTLENSPEDGDAARAVRMKAVRDEIRDEILTKGYDADRKTFVQSYGSKNLDAALLMMPLVGFLPATDERIRGTVAAIQKDLTTDGFVARYSTEEDVDGLPPGEGAFLPCTFWLADNLALMGRVDEARSLLGRLIGLANDVGLLAEEYDPASERQLGNFPQAFTHVSLVNSACNLAALTSEEGDKTSPHRRRGR